MTDIDKLAGSVDSLQAGFETHRYICSSQIATAVYLAYQLRKPVPVSYTHLTLPTILLV